MNTMSTTATKNAPDVASGVLTGVRVVVTHDKEQAKDQAELFGALGAEVFYYPCIEILPYDQDGELDALHLDHYPGFTEAEVERLATAVAARHGVDELLVIHRAGEVAPREPIVLVAAMSPHRRAAFDAVSELMDYLKTDAPFWKREVRGETSRWIEPTDLDRSRRNAFGE